MWFLFLGCNLNQLNPFEEKKQNKSTTTTNIRNHPFISSIHSFYFSDSLSLLDYTTSSHSHHTQLIGFDHNLDAFINQQFSLDPSGTLPFISHPFHQVKQWLGRTTISAYLTHDGTIHPLINSSQRIIRATYNVPHSRYQMITVSDNGQVLAVVSRSDHGSQDLNKITHRLELWSSLQDLLEFAQTGFKSDLNPQVFHVSNSDCRQTEVQLASGASHFLILTHTPSSTQSLNPSDYHSTLYSFGDNRYGQLGIGSHAPSTHQPSLIQDLPGLVKIHCGLFHSAAIGVDGELYTFGYNRHGQCGVGKTRQVDLTSPVLIDLGGHGESGRVIDVIDVKCGSEHTVLLTPVGVWVAGSNALGQLGLEDPDPQFEFQQLKDTISTVNVASACQIQTGRWNTFIWSND